MLRHHLTYSIEYDNAMKNGKLTYTLGDGDRGVVWWAWPRRASRTGHLLVPIVDRGWSREAFGFAIALQNLVWGLAQPSPG